jgi:hypothetical protein
MNSGKSLKRRFEDINDPNFLANNEVFRKNSKNFISENIFLRN